MYQNELTEMKLRYNLLHEENYGLQSKLMFTSMKLRQLQEDNQKIVTRCMELKHEQRHSESDITVCI